MHSSTSAPRPAGWGLVSMELLALALCAGATHADPTGLLNDTGQTQCANASNVVGACDSATTGDAGARPRQDGRFGRDVASPAKVGGGAAGFDFTKVCQDGSLDCAGSANTGASPAPADWSCTKDNVTNLIWSLQSGNGDWTTYAQVTLPAAHDAANRCGFSSGWRLPTRRELFSLLHLGLGGGPTIDATYFPATANFYYWTADTVIYDQGQVWNVNFIEGTDTTVPKGNSAYVRLVRSGP